MKACPRVRASLLKYSQVSGTAGARLRGFTAMRSGQFDCFMPSTLAANHHHCQRFRNLVILAQFLTKSQGSRSSDQTRNLKPPSRCREMQCIASPVKIRWFGPGAAHSIVGQGMRRSRSQTPHVATIRVHSLGQSTCLSTARSGTVELQRAHVCGRFPELFVEVREWIAIMYQMRHGAASHATAVDGHGFSELPAQFRQLSAPNTALCSRHLRQYSRHKAGAIASGPSHQTELARRCAPAASGPGAFFFCRSWLWHR